MSYISSFCKISDHQNQCKKMKPQTRKKYTHTSIHKYICINICDKELLYKIYILKCLQINNKKANKPIKMDKTF